MSRKHKSNRELHTTLQRLAEVSLSVPLAEGEELFDLAELAKYVISECRSRRLVYTAFDGDQQIFTPFMKEFVARQGGVPVNPDSILGYKDTVEARLTKRGVLIDDLSVLRSCDELVVFTQYEPGLADVPRLAEGVLIEIIFFRYRFPEREVRFVDPLELARGGQPKGQILNASFDELRDCLSSSQSKEILSLANSGRRIDKSLRSGEFFIFDSQEFKYSTFVRAYGYSSNKVPVVPYLGVELGVFQIAARSNEIALADTVIAWCCLMRLATSATRLGPIEPDRQASPLSELLRLVWLEQFGPETMEDTKDWTDYKVLKASQRSRWAITRKERDFYAEDGQ